MLDDLVPEREPPEDPVNVIERDVRERSQPASSTAPDPGPSTSPPKWNETSVPRWVADRFLRVDNQYFFADRHLAFTDNGNKLKAESHSAEVVRSLIAIAEARGWDAVTVRGTAEFKREVWREATLRDIEVHGYAPSELDRAALQHDARRRQQSDRPTHPTDPAGDPTQRNGAAAPAAPADEGTRRITGRLIEHGPAPYKFDDQQALSYFVRVKTDAGEELVWGVDLERALVESRSKVRTGDVVAVKRGPSRPVTVKVPRRNQSGDVIGSQIIETERNTWSMETTDWLAERAQRADDFQGNMTRQALVERHPDITSAIVGLWLGEQFADQAIERLDDRANFVARV